MEDSIKIFDYDKLERSKDSLIRQFHKEGFIAIRNVPDYVQAYKNFITSAQSFTSLSHEERLKSQARDLYKRGWSYGDEAFDGVKDSFKGSYYAHIPEDEENSPNIWPPLPNFKKNYLALANIIFEAGREILPLIGMKLYNLSATARMLYYGPVYQSQNDNNPHWCGLHTDLVLLTGLCPAIYIKENNIVAKPKGSGLSINDKEVSVPDNVLLFQIGKVAELISNGKVSATEHLVNKAYGGYERYAFALFLDCERDYKIKSTVTKYNDRYKYGMTYGEWWDNSYQEKYG